MFGQSTKEQSTHTWLKSSFLIQIIYLVSREAIKKLLPWFNITVTGPGPLVSNFCKTLHSVFFGNMHYQLNFLFFQ